MESVWTRHSGHGYHGHGPGQGRRARSRGSAVVHDDAQQQQQQQQQEAQEEEGELQRRPPPPPPPEIFDDPPVPVEPRDDEIMQLPDQVTVPQPPAPMVDLETEALRRIAESNESKPEWNNVAKGAMYETSESMDRLVDLLAGFNDLSHPHALVDISKELAVFNRWVRDVLRSPVYSGESDVVAAIRSDFRILQDAEPGLQVTVGDTKYTAVQGSGINVQVLNESTGFHEYVESSKITDSLDLYRLMSESTAAEKYNMNVDEAMLNLSEQAEVVKKARTKLSTQMPEIGPDTDAQTALEVYKFLTDDESLSRVHDNIQAIQRDAEIIPKQLFSKDPGIIDYMVTTLRDYSDLGYRAERASASLTGPQVAPAAAAENVQTAATDAEFGPGTMENVAAVLAVDRAAKQFLGRKTQSNSVALENLAKFAGDVAVARTNFSAFLLENSPRPSLLKNMKDAEVEFLRVAEYYASLRLPIDLGEFYENVKTLVEGRVAADMQLPVGVYNEQGVYELDNWQTFDRAMRQFNGGADSLRGLYRAADYKTAESYRDMHQMLREALRWAPDATEKDSELQTRPFLPSQPDTYLPSKKAMLDVLEAMSIVPPSSNNDISSSGGGVRTTRSGRASKPVSKKISKHSQRY